MKNSDKFLEFFSAIEKQLKKITHLDSKSSFYQFVENASHKHSEVRHYKDDLKEYADLRNAIVHERSDSHVIAEPNEQAVIHLEKIKNNILKPPPIYPTFKKAVLSFDANNSIAEAVKAMQEHSFSQVPVIENGKFKSILTANTVTRWLGANVKDDVFSLSETTIDFVLKYTEKFERCEFIPKNQSIFETINIFHEIENKGCRLEAAFITEHGKKSEKIIGIVTLADFPKLLKKIYI